MNIEIEKLNINYKAREWCKLPYPDHPDGCPTYSQNAMCPPNVPLVDEYFDLSKELYFVVIEFDIGGHAKKMKKLHPRWSDRQCRNLLYWQNGVRSQLDGMCRLSCWGKSFVYTLLPEAMGINVIATAQSLGIPIKIKPTDTIYKIALVGNRNNKNKIKEQQK